MERATHYFMWQLQQGDLKACEALLNAASILLRKQNASGEEPLALAAAGKVHQFLKSRVFKRSSLLQKFLLTGDKEGVAGWQDRDGNTLLHSAAAAGDLEACEALLNKAGVALRKLNKLGQEPLALAATREVDQYLRSRLCCRHARFGYGNAYDEMKRDERAVSEVEWYTAPLRGAPGKLGGRHSFLVITAAEMGQPAKRYVLEKADSPAAAAHQKHGVFISSQDLSMNLLSVDGAKPHRTRLNFSDGTLAGSKGEGFARGSSQLGALRPGLLQLPSRGSASLQPLRQERRPGDESPERVVGHVGWCSPP